QVVHDTIMASAHEAADHVRTHPAEPNHPELHVLPPILSGTFNDAAPAAENTGVIPLSYRRSAVEAVNPRGQVAQERAHDAVKSRLPLRDPGPCDPPGPLDDRPLAWGLDLFRPGRPGRSRDSS